METTTASFYERCYSALRLVPAGKVTTYQDLANYIGTKAVRAVGTAMRKNPDVPNTPCHRVVRSDGSVGQYAYGQDKKIALLETEGVEVSGVSVSLERFRFSFPKGACL
jgi:methylated-DNA-[protein]-cysteine S-methyltransferase